MPSWHRADWRVHRHLHCVTVHRHHTRVARQRYQGGARFLPVCHRAGESWRDGGLEIVQHGRPFYELRRLVLLSHGASLRLLGRRCAQPHRLSSRWQRCASAPERHFVVDDDGRRISARPGVLGHASDAGVLVVHHLDRAAYRRVRADSPVQQCNCRRSHDVLLGISNELWWWWRRRWYYSAVGGCAEHDGCGYNTHMACVVHAAAADRRSGDDPAGALFCTRFALQL